MRILSQTNDIQGYHGTVGTQTNMYDYRGERLFVGDVVCLVTCASMYLGITPHRPSRFGGRKYRQQTKPYFFTYCQQRMVFDFVNSKIAINGIEFFSPFS